MSPDVLILSSIYDFAADLVALELKERGVPFLRLNREQMADYELALDPFEPALRVTLGSALWHVSPSLKSVWFRQPVFLRNTPSEPMSPEAQLEQSQWMAFLRGLSVFGNARWMNAPRATYLAESKPYQLFLANQIGFRVPSTIVGNDASAVADKFATPFVVKSLDTVLVNDGDDTLFTYTTVQRLPLRSDALRAAPIIAQEFIEPKTDIRVTLIGQNLSAVRILGKGQGISGDWRVLPKMDLSYHDYELDPATVGRCKEMTEKLGLAFGAIDLVETESGIQFIEINPTGEWAWLSGQERKLEKAIADWLSQ